MWSSVVGEISETNCYITSPLPPRWYVDHGRPVVHVSRPHVSTTKLSHSRRLLRPLTPLNMTTGESDAGASMVNDTTACPTPPRGVTWARNGLSRQHGVASGCL